MVSEGSKKYEKLSFRWRRRFPSRGPRHPLAARTQRTPLLRVADALVQVNTLLDVLLCVWGWHSCVRINKWSWELEGENDRLRELISNSEHLIAQQRLTHNFDTRTHDLGLR